MGCNNYPKDSESNDYDDSRDSDGYSGCSGSNEPRPVIRIATKRGVARAATNKTVNPKSPIGTGIPKMRGGVMITIVWTMLIVTVISILMI